MPDCGCPARAIACTRIPLLCSSTARRSRPRCPTGRRRSRRSSVPGRRTERMRRHHELPFGAELTSDGVRFRLWAPRAKEVAVRVDRPMGTVPMRAEPDGWFSVTTGEAGPGSRYRYIVDGAAYPDPA